MFQQVDTTEAANGTFFLKMTKNNDELIIRASFISSVQFD